MGLFSNKTNDLNKSSRVTPSSSTQVPTNSGQITTTQQNKAQYRPIFLLVWPNATFKAHWAIFVPASTDKTFKTGTYIHVTGALDKGFKFEIVRGWDLDMTLRRPQSPIEIGWIQADWINDAPFERNLIKEATPRDQLENFLAATAAPSGSLNRVSSGEASTGKGRKVELSDCQWWVTKCIQGLVEQGVLIAPQRGLNKFKDPLEMIAQAPRH
nr:hypothetical protein CFP56_13153 [Quercus suber]